MSRVCIVDRSSSRDPLLASAGSVPGGGSGSAGLLSCGHAQVRRGDCKGLTSGAVPAPDGPWHHHHNVRVLVLLDCFFFTIAENDALRR